MNNQLISTGKKICISFDDSNLNDYKYVSQIVDVIDQTNIIISSPFYKNILFRIRYRQTISILIISENGLFVFDGTCAEEIIENNVVMYKVIISENPKRLQRRNYYRLSTSLPIIYQFNKENETYFGQAVTKDISGGGIRFVCSDELGLNENINIIVKLNDESEFESKATVIRCTNIGIKKFEICAEYKDVKTNKRDELIKFLFAVQQEILREKNNK